MEQIEQAVMYALGPQVDPNLKAQVTIQNLVLKKKGALSNTVVG